MKIIFNLLNVGIGNNGGSHSLVKSANILSELGNDVVIVSDGKSQYTWGKIVVPYLKIKDINEVFGDVIIATGIRSLKSTNKSKIKKKYHYIRGHEIWNFPEKELIEKIQESPTIKIVNSICLKNKLKSFNIESTIIRPGYDFNEIFPLNIRGENKKIILGGIFNQGKKRQTKRTEWIFLAYKILKEKYPIELMMYGSDGEPVLFLDKYLKDPTIEEKNKLYNMIDIWLSPSELEGLHIPPAEALLTECSVVTTNAKMSGTEDYIINDQTGLVSENNFNSFLSCIEILINHKMIRKELGKSGREKILSLGSRKDNMLKMIEFFGRNE